MKAGDGIKNLLTQFDLDMQEAVNKRLANNQPVEQPTQNKFHYSR